MFKEEYNKQFEEITPSPALEQETLALMAEAQAHGFIAPPPQKSKKPLILSLSLSGAAAMVAITVGLSFWFHRPEAIDRDLAGDINQVLAGNSSAQSDKSENDADPEDDAAKGNPAPEQNDGDASTGGDDAAGGNTVPEDQAPSTGGSDNFTNNSGDYDPSQKYDSDETTGAAPAPVSPVGPVVVEDKNTETYLSIQAYLDAMTAKKTVGYNKNYMADPALVIVPSQLPQTVQFRHLYAKANGAYSYSYLLTDGENQYFLEIAAPATFPRTQRDLNLRVRALKDEYEGMDKAENKRIYYFGNYEKITVTLTTVNGAAPTLEETDRLLANLQLDRYTEQNTLVQMTYE